ncbi:MAG: hypothetical protein QM774_13080 [Gordonia sp. (in: high G+C Gram-positive bacteria)]|uniref:hypothetical protein n=1 Tax=Gordonia sp. (in: high G+C Gram-positive bacteria) TaxID=84139 RepID=UPI0039E3CDDE
MTDSPVTNRPDPATRPPTVTWALRLWLISGGLLIVLGVASIITNIVGSGWDFGVVAVAILVAVVGLAYVLLARKAYCEPQWRGALAALTIVAVAMLLVLTVGFQAAGLAVVLFAAVIGLFGSILAYRPDADAWFNGRDPNEPKPEKSGKKRRK